MEFTKKEDLLKKLGNSKKQKKKKKAASLKADLEEMGAKIERAINERYQEEGNLVVVSLDPLDYDYWDAVIAKCMKQLKIAGWETFLDYGTGDMEGITLEIS